jgi:hypothetical protein
LCENLGFLARRLPKRHHIVLIKKVKYPCTTLMGAAKSWRRLKGENQLPKVIQGVIFRNGVEVTNAPEKTAA